MMGLMAWYGGGGGTTAVSCVGCLTRTARSGAPTALSTRLRGLPLSTSRTAVAVADLAGSGNFTFQVAVCVATTGLCDFQTKRVEVYGIAPDLLMDFQGDAWACSVMDVGALIKPLFRGPDTLPQGGGVLEWPYTVGAPPPSRPK